MALVPWDIHVRTGQLALFASLLTTVLVSSVRRRRPRPAGAQAPAAPAPPTPSESYRVPVVPTHSTPSAPADPVHAAAVTDLCTCISELASDLAKRYGGEL
ncbi:hypothetical protein [Streptomyces sp. VRA16 Mangrove soil]|uniref:hypothetical protein n=1 Tax=Streptomyces sp. VRA16 Mangrove soil TaxID=2817434 RepID=UPI001A9D4EC0|nr:hypothetical protein [Streptomyces sp. VRA16 Mangrove soil]MBO1329670.1 hypothetical protein [Streptomyces sp. VRA16 Mangrove soil]